uniref:Uncharacterized protein LOC111125634 isoform X8 n=1 Tax=Crassostrea virginica TaxID=6565 RepID=A0A8B8DBD1_CRAVI|nr:uncharacterized protein LOC111125634 isoform X8 [Crassostrea virginica]
MEPRPILRKNLGLIIKNDIIRENERLSRSPSYERGGMLSPYQDRSPTHSPSFTSRDSSLFSPRGQRDLLSPSYGFTSRRSPSPSLSSYPDSSYSTWQREPRSSSSAISHGSVQMYEDDVLISSERRGRSIDRRVSTGSTKSYYREDRCIYSRTTADTRLSSSFSRSSYSDRENYSQYQRAHYRDASPVTVQEKLSTSVINRDLLSNLDDPPSPRIHVSHPTESSQDAKSPNEQKKQEILDQEKKIVSISQDSEFHPNITFHDTVISGQTCDRKNIPVKPSSISNTPPTLAIKSEKSIYSGNSIKSSSHTLSHSLLDNSGKNEEQDFILKMRIPSSSFSDKQVKTDEKMFLSVEGGHLMLETTGGTVVKSGRRTFSVMMDQPKRISVDRSTLERRLSGNEGSLVTQGNEGSLVILENILDLNKVSSVGNIDVKKMIKDEPLSESIGVCDIAAKGPKEESTSSETSAGSAGISNAEAIEMKIDKLNAGRGEVCEEQGKSKSEERRVSDRSKTGERNVPQSIAKHETERKFDIGLKAEHDFCKRNDEHESKCFEYQDQTVDKACEDLEERRPRSGQRESRAQSQRLSTDAEDRKDRRSRSRTPVRFLLVSSKLESSNGRDSPCRMKDHSCSTDRKKTNGDKEQKFSKKNKATSDTMDQTLKTENKNMVSKEKVSTAEDKSQNQVETKTVETLQKQEDNSNRVTNQTNLNDSSVKADRPGKVLEVLNENSAKESKKDQSDVKEKQFNTEENKTKGNAEKMNVEERSPVSDCKVITLTLKPFAQDQNQLDKCAIIKKKEDRLLTNVGFSRNTKESKNMVTSEKQETEMGTKSPGLLKVVNDTQLKGKEIQEETSKGDIATFTELESPKTTEHESSKTEKMSNFGFNRDRLFAKLDPRAYKIESTKRKSSSSSDSSVKSPDVFISGQATCTATSFAFTTENKTISNVEKSNDDKSLNSSQETDETSRKQKISEKLLPSECILPRTIQDHLECEKETTNNTEHTNRIDTKKSEHKGKDEDISPPKETLAKEPGNKSKNSFTDKKDSAVKSEAKSDRKQKKETTDLANVKDGQKTNQSGKEPVSFKDLIRKTRSRLNGVSDDSDSEQQTRNMPKAKTTETKPKLKNELENTDLKATGNIVTNKSGGQKNTVRKDELLKSATEDSSRNIPQGKELGSSRMDGRDNNSASLQQERTSFSKSEECLLIEKTEKKIMNAGSKGKTEAVKQECNTSKRDISPSQKNDTLLSSSKSDDEKTAKKEQAGIGSKQKNQNDNEKEYMKSKSHSQFLSTIDTSKEDLKMSTFKPGAKNIETEETSKLLIEKNSQGIESTKHMGIVKNSKLKQDEVSSDVNVDMNMIKGKEDTKIKVKDNGTQTEDNIGIVKNLAASTEGTKEIVKDSAASVRIDNKERTEINMNEQSDSSKSLYKVGSPKQKREFPAVSSNDKALEDVKLDLKQVRANLQSQKKVMSPKLEKKEEKKQTYFTDKESVAVEKSNGLEQTSMLVENDDRKLNSPKNSPRTEKSKQTPFQLEVDIKNPTQRKKKTEIHKPDANAVNLKDMIGNMKTSLKSKPKGINGVNTERECKVFPQVTSITARKEDQGKQPTDKENVKDSQALEAKDTLEKQQRESSLDKGTDDKQLKPVAKDKKELTIEIGKEAKHTKPVTCNQERKDFILEKGKEAQLAKPVVNDKMDSTLENSKGVQYPNYISRDQKNQTLKKEKATEPNKFVTQIGKDSALEKRKIDMDENLKADDTKTIKQKERNQSENVSNADEIIPDSVSTTGEKALGKMDTKDKGIDEDKSKWKQLDKKVLAKPKGAIDDNVNLKNVLSKTKEGLQKPVKPIEKQSPECQDLKSGTPSYLLSKDDKKQENRLKDKDIGAKGLECSQEMRILKDNKPDSKNDKLSGEKDLMDSTGKLKYQDLNNSKLTGSDVKKDKDGGQGVNVKTLQGQVPQSSKSIDQDVKTNKSVVEDLKDGKAGKMKDNSTGSREGINITGGNVNDCKAENEGKDDRSKLRGQNLKERETKDLKTIPNKIRLENSQESKTGAPDLKDFKAKHQDHKSAEHDSKAKVDVGNLQDCKSESQGKKYAKIAQNMKDSMIIGMVPKDEKTSNDIQDSRVDVMKDKLNSKKLNAEYPETKKSHSNQTFDCADSASDSNSTVIKRIRPVEIADIKLNEEGYGSNDRSLKKITNLSIKIEKRNNNEKPLEESQKKKPPSTNLSKKSAHTLLDENSRSDKSAISSNVTNKLDKQSSDINIKQKGRESENRHLISKTTDGKTIVPDTANTKSISSSDVNHHSQADDEVHFTHSTDLRAKEPKLVNQGKKSNEMCQGTSILGSHRKTQSTAKNEAKVTGVTESPSNLDRKEETSYSIAKLKTAREADCNSDLKKSSREGLQNGDKSVTAQNKKSVNNDAVQDAPREIKSVIIHSGISEAINRGDNSTDTTHVSNDSKTTKTDVSGELPKKNESAKKKLRLRREFIVINDNPPVCDTEAADLKMKDLNEAPRDEAIISMKSDNKSVKIMEKDLKVHNDSQTVKMVTENKKESNKSKLLEDLHQASIKSQMNLKDKNSAPKEENHNSLMSPTDCQPQKGDNLNTENKAKPSKLDLLQTKSKNRHKFELPVLKSAKPKAPVKTLSDNEGHESMNDKEDSKVFVKENQGEMVTRNKDQVLCEDTKIEKEKILDRKSISKSALKIKFDVNEKYTTESEAYGSYQTKHNRESLSINKNTLNSTESKHSGGSPKQTRKKMATTGSEPIAEESPKKVQFKDVDKDYQRKVYAQEVAKKIQTSIIAEMRNKLRSKAAAVEKHQERIKAKEIKTVENDLEQKVKVAKIQSEVKDQPEVKDQSKVKSLSEVKELSQMPKSKTELTEDLSSQLVKPQKTPGKVSDSGEKIKDSLSIASSDEKYLDKEIRKFENNVSKRVEQPTTESRRTAESVRTNELKITSTRKNIDGKQKTAGGDGELTQDKKRGEMDLLISKGVETRQKDDIKFISTSFSGPESMSKGSADKTSVNLNNKSADMSQDTTERKGDHKSDRGFFNVSKYITNTKIQEFKKQLNADEAHSEKEQILSEKDVKISRSLKSQQPDDIQFISTSFAGPESPNSNSSNSKEDQSSPELTYKRFDFDDTSESKSPSSSDSTVRAEQGSDEEVGDTTNEDIMAELRKLLPLEIFSTRRKHKVEESAIEDEDQPCDCCECQGSSDEEYSVDGRIPQLSVIGEEDEETVSVFDPDKMDNEDMEFHRNFMEKVYGRNPRASKVFNPGVIVVSGSESSENEETEELEIMEFEGRKKPVFDIEAFLKYNGNVEDWLERIEDFVPPRLPIEKPELYTISPESVALTWKRARVPDKIRDTCNLTYTVEVRNPPNLDWREMLTGLTTTNADIKGLHPRLDYLFRIRAWNEYGCSEPSLPVSLHRPIELSDEYDSGEDWDEQYRVTLGDLDTPIDEAPPKLPMETPRIIDSGETAKLSWLPARIPAYAKKTPITYIIEIKEPHVPGWSRLTSGISDTNYFIEGLRPTQDYQFRVKAETQYGVSDPTLPVSLDRPKEIGKKGDFIPDLGYYEIFKRDWEAHTDKGKRSSIDLLREDIDLPIKREPQSPGVPPRIPSSRPLISHQYPDRLTLSWMPARVPSYVKNQRLTYIVEVREPPSTLWRSLIDDLRDTEFDVTDLNPEQDYLFRVRAKNEYGLSEPTMPASVIRTEMSMCPEVTVALGLSTVGAPGSGHGPPL